MRNEGDQQLFSKSGLSKRTLYEFLRANSSTATAHPLHRTPWLNKPRSTAPISFPSSGKTEHKTALQRLAAEPLSVPKTFDSESGKKRPIPAKQQPVIDVDPVKPPPMFETVKKERRALVVSHIKGSTPERIRKHRALSASPRLNSGRLVTRQMLTIDDLHKAVLGINFDKIDESMPETTVEGPQMSFDSLEDYKQHQSEVLLVETMEGFRQSLSTGFGGGGSSMYSAVNVQVTTVVRKGRDFCLLTLKKMGSEEEFLSQGDVVLLMKPTSPLVEPLLKYGLMSELSPRILHASGERVMFGIIERSKPSLLIGKSGKSVQLRVPLASKDCVLGYSPSDAGTIGSEFVAVVIHSVLTVEREWTALCCLKREDWIVPCLLGNRQIESENGHNRLERNTISFSLKKELNESQQIAIEKAVSCPLRSLVIVQGPPGTGKTHTLVTLLKTLHAMGTRKILVGAPSNAAIDELLLRFSAFVSHSKLIRIGRNSSTEGLEKFSLEAKVVASQSAIEESRYAAYKDRKDKLYADIGRLNEEIATNGSSKGESVRMKERVKAQLDALKSKEEEHVRVERDSIYKKFLGDAQFVFGTLSSFGSDIVRDNLVGSVDVCIIDEAAQAIEAASLIPLQFRPAKLVLVGDPQQLPAVVKSVAAKRAGFDMSLMERMQLLGNPTYLLKEQYRMDPQIAEFPSLMFYENQLRTHASVLTRDQDDCPMKFFHVDGANDLKQGTSLINPREAQVVVDLVRTFLDRQTNRVGKGPLSIGVISPYKQQVNLLRSLLSREIEMFGPKIIEIDSVDAFQGREKDLIVFSCVRAGGSGDHSVGFLADQRRLNVAITRAKRALWLVGNRDFLKTNGGPVWSALIDYCQSLTEENGCIREKRLRSM
jgi:predicted DNA helicase